MGDIVKKKPSFKKGFTEVQSNFVQKELLGKPFPKGTIRQPKIKSRASEALYIAFPDYLIDTETRLGKVGHLGHAGVVLIDERGNTKYYEYGRYHTEDGTKGKVRNVKVPNVTIGHDGKATEDSLKRLLSSISKKSGQRGKIEAAYFENVDFKIMNKYALERLEESNLQYKKYNRNRKPYSLLDNNCGTFAEDVITQDTCVNKPRILNSSPNNIVDEYWEEGNARVFFDPEKSKLIIEQGNETDAKKKICQ